MTQVCYIGGFGRSGSTLLERLIAATTGFCALGEVVWVWERGVLRDELCGCGERFSQCQFWSAVGDLAFGGWHKVDASTVESLRASVDRTRRIPGLRVRNKASERSLEYSDYLSRIYMAAAQVSGAPTVIDSSKHPSTAFNLRLNSQVQMRVLHVIRDSRGVAYSWTKTVRRPEAGEAGLDEYMYQYTPRQSAILWNAQNIAFIALAASGIPTRELKYEQFLADPAGAISSIAEFLGTKAETAECFIDDRTVTLGRAHQVSGNTMRFQTGRMVLREDDAWRTNFAALPRATVTALTLPLLARFGYLKLRNRKQRS